MPCHVMSTLLASDGRLMGCDNFKMTSSPRKKLRRFEQVYSNLSFVSSILLDHASTTFPVPFCQSIGFTQQ